jgi:hypothetical protein
MRTSALPLCLARLRFSPFMTTIASILRMGAGWRLWRHSWLITGLFWWQFVASLAWVMQTLVHCVLTVISACIISSDDLLPFPIDVFGGMCGECSCNVFLMLFMVLGVPNFATLCKRVVLMLWHAFLFLGLTLVGLSILVPFLLGGFHCLFL